MSFNVYFVFYCNSVNPAYTAATPNKPVDLMWLVVAASGVLTQTDAGAHFNSLLSLISVKN